MAPDAAAEIRLDHDRRRRIGLDEAVLCDSKSDAQITAIVEQAGGGPLLLTRLDAARLRALPPAIAASIAHDPVARTGVVGEAPAPAGPPRVAVVTAGTSDVPVAREALATLAYHGEAALMVADVGVAGIWRLMERIDELRALPVVIVVCGMDAALASVVGGLVPGLVVAVPTSVGYGVARGGETALRATLASCAPGLVVVNIDNGYGAACAALRALARP
jgi:pyridinium-3,5-biscarboxylic acid mononucleotide synthase